MEIVPPIRKVGMMKKILGCMRRAIQDFDLINDGDSIGVAVSGGKDSMVLLKALKQYQSFSPVNFKLESFTVNLGFNDFQSETIRAYCNELNIPCNIIDTKISEIVFNVRDEKNPCSLCAKMRKGAINNKMKESGFNKLALAHHEDDALNTLFLSMLYEGRISTLKPLTYLSRKEIYVIRPFLYLQERDIKACVGKYNIPVVKNPCPVDKETKREEINNLLKEIYRKIPGSRERLVATLKNRDGLNLWF